MKLSRITLPNWRDGIVRESAIDEVLATPSSCQYAQNLNFDRLGAFQTRNGLTKIGNTIEAFPVLGMHNYVNNAGDTYRLFAKVNTSIYAYNGSTWTAVLTGLGASDKARFTSLVDYTFVATGGEIKSSAGSTFGTTNTGDLPACDFIENYRSRLWALDSANDKLYYTDVVNTDGTISGGTSFIQISPQDGGKGTGLKRYQRALLVFKTNNIYRVFSINSTDPDPFISIGTYSNESIVETKNGLYFHSPTGFYRYNDTSFPEEISRPIIDIIQAIPRSYYENICGWTDGDYIYWSIGDITLNGVSLSNVVCRRTISKEVWTIYSYAEEIRSACQYDDGTNLITVVGTDVGNVHHFDYGNDDNGTEIHYSLETHYYYISNIKSDIKKIKEISALFENAQGAMISYSINDDKEWKPIGNITESLSQVIGFESEFVRIKFKISGTNKGNTLIFRGLELISSYLIDVGD
jgi:hypothetical protein